MEFDKIANELLERNVVNNGAKIEHQICTTKERFITFPFKVIPKLIVTNITYFVVLWLNTFPL